MSKPIHNYIVFVRPRGKNMLPKVAYFAEERRTGRIGLEVSSFEAAMNALTLQLSLTTGTVSEVRPYANGIGLIRRDKEKMIVSQEDSCTFDFSLPGWGKEPHDVAIRIYEVDPSVQLQAVIGKDVLGWADGAVLDTIHAESADYLNGRIVREVVNCISRPCWPN